MELNKEKVMKALECCGRKVKDCYRCPYIFLCQELYADCLTLITALTKENEKLSMFNKLLEQDIADRDEMLEKKVEEIYPEFMRDYKCMREELDGNYEEMREIKERLKQAICDNTYPDFNREGKPINVWNAITGYDLIDQIAKEMLEGK